MSKEKTVFVTLNRHDLELLIDGYSMEFIAALDPAMMHTPAGESKEAYHDAVRPVVKKLSEFVEKWEELNEKEEFAGAMRAAAKQDEATHAITRTVTSA